MIPIYKAKTIKGIEVEGLLTTNQFGNYCIKPINSDNSPCVGEVNPYTLKISFDGESWYNKEDVILALEMFEAMRNIR